MSKQKSEEEEFWNESEYSPINFSLKLIAYPIGLISGALAIWMMSALEIKGIIMGVLILTIVGRYFYFEWKIISR